MEFQTFRGSDVQSALHAVRQALGADAWIESTRHISNGQGGAFGKSFVEVTAAPSMIVARPQARTGNELEAFALRSSPTPRVAGKKPARVGGARLDPAAVERELTYLRTMLDELSAGRPPRERAHAMLLAAGFEGALLKQLANGATKAARGGREVLRKWLRQRVQERLLTQGKMVERPQRQIIACVGPTGAGKTTTLAKLAARAFIELDRHVSVISLDTFRVGAVEQWKRYAQLIGMPFDVVREPHEFRGVVDAQAAELVFVDTAGKSSQDDSSIERLARCLATTPEIRTEVLLVLPAWLRARDAERVASAYCEPRLTGMVLTKLDETEQVGGVLHAALGGQLPIAYLCDGARVPEDIHDAAPEAVLDVLFPEQA